MLRKEGDGQNRVSRITRFFTTFQSLYGAGVSTIALLAFLLTNACKVISDATILAVFTEGWARTIRLWTSPQYLQHLAPALFPSRQVFSSGPFCFLGFCKNLISFGMGFCMAPDIFFNWIEALSLLRYSCL